MSVLKDRTCNNQMLRERMVASLHIKHFHPDQLMNQEGSLRCRYRLVSLFKFHCNLATLQPCKPPSPCLCNPSISLKLRIDTEFCSSSNGYKDDRENLFSSLRRDHLLVLEQLLDGLGGLRLGPLEGHLMVKDISVSDEKGQRSETVLTPRARSQMS